MFAFLAGGAVHAGLGYAIAKWKGKVIIRGDDNIQGFVVETDLAVVDEPREPFLEVVRFSLSTYTQPWLSCTSACPKRS
jgi:hypothetical protein